MDKLHFDDLTKITCPPGMLDDDTFQRLRTWPHGIEYWNGVEWRPADPTCFPYPVKLHCTQVYRARPAPLTPDVVPWHLLDDRLKVACRYESGLVLAAEVVDLNTTLLGHCMRIDLLKGYQPGTVHWRDSLQKRPEGV